MNTLWRHVRWLFVRSLFTVRFSDVTAIITAVIISIVSWATQHDEYSRMYMKCVFFMTPLKSASTDIKRNTARTVTGCWKRRSERWDSTECGYSQKDIFVNTVMNNRVRKRVENFVYEWQLDRKGGRLHEVIPLSEGNIRILYGTQSLSLHIAVTEAMTQRLQVWRYRYHCRWNSSYVSKLCHYSHQRVLCHCISITTDRSPGTKQGKLSWASQMAPGKAVRYHGPVKWHRVRLTLPWAGKMAPGRAERYQRQVKGHQVRLTSHGQVKWHQARLNVTIGR
jgi:hypothetical protein